MEEDSKDILLKSLENYGVTIPHNISSIKDLSPPSLVSICSQSLQLIDPIRSSPSSLPDDSVGDRVRLCTDIADGVRNLGFIGEISFYKLLYPSEEDLYKLVRFLVGRLSESSRLSISRDIANASEKIRVAEAFSNQVVEANLKELKLNSKGVVEEHRDTRKEMLVREDAVVRDVEQNVNSHEMHYPEARHEIKRLQNQEKMLREELTAKTIGLQHLEEEVEALEAVAKIISDGQHPIDSHAEQLSQQVDAKRHKLDELELEWDATTKSLEDKMKSLRESLYASNLEGREKLKKIGEIELETKSVLIEIKRRTDEYSKLIAEVEKQPELPSRRSYIQQIMEITKNSRKQDADIEQILKDTRELQLESNSIQERLHRTYAILDEIVFREAKKDPVARQAYRHLTTIHEAFEQISEKILATDRLRREAAEHEAKVAAIRSRSLSIDKLQADLDAIRRENEYLEQRLQKSSTY